VKLVKFGLLQQFSSNTSLGYAIFELTYAKTAEKFQLTDYTDLKGACIGIGIITRYRTSFNVARKKQDTAC